MWMYYSYYILVIHVNVTQLYYYTLPKHLSNQFKLEFTNRGNQSSVLSPAFKPVTQSLILTLSTMHENLFHLMNFQYPIIVA